MSAQTHLRHLAALESPEGDGEPSALMLAEIYTGRTHQIRRHLAGLGHPVLMDDQHGDFGANKRWSKGLRARGLSRPKHLMLHAFRLTLPHRGTELCIQAPPPPAWPMIIQSLSGAVDALEHIS